MKTASELCKAGVELSDILDRWSNRWGMVSIEALAVVSTAVGNMMGALIRELIRHGASEEQAERIACEELQKLLDAIRRERTSS